MRAPSEKAGALRRICQVRIVEKRIERRAATLRHTRFAGRKPTRAIDFSYAPRQGRLMSIAAPLQDISDVFGKIPAEASRSSYYHYYGYGTPWAGSI